MSEYFHFTVFLGKFVFHVHHFDDADLVGKGVVEFTLDVYGLGFGWGRRFRSAIATVAAFLLLLRGLLLLQLMFGFSRLRLRVRLDARVPAVLLFQHGFVNFGAGVEWILHRFVFRLYSLSREQILHFLEFEIWLLRHFACSLEIFGNFLQKIRAGLHHEVLVLAIFE